MMMTTGVSTAASQDSTMVGLVLLRTQGPFPSCCSRPPPLCRSQHKQRYEASEDYLRAGDQLGTAEEVSRLGVLVDVQREELLVLRVGAGIV